MEIRPRHALDSRSVSSGAGDLQRRSACRVSWVGGRAGDRHHGGLLSFVGHSQGVGARQARCVCCGHGYNVIADKQSDAICGPGRRA